MFKGRDFGYDSGMMASSEVAIAEKLVTWYEMSHRSLPWRETSDPYAIWLSEIMLQQTQVASVLPYYERFLAKFPTIRVLAAASLDEVLKSWEGLGYYARARNLHKAAQALMKDHGGNFPSSFEAIHALPGIGESTAGAIATFAFKNPHPILDGNVKRVLSRLRGIEEPVQTSSVQTRLWETSRALLPQEPEAAYAFNQAIMELGATLCTPKQPDCPRCPWRDDCQAFAQGRQDKIPLKQPAKKTPHYTIGVGVVRQDDKLLIALRPEEGLLGGLWEFPGGKCRDDETLQSCVKREILEETGLTVHVGAEIARIKHAYSHFRITLHAFDCDYLSGTPEPKASQRLLWVPLEEIEQYAFPKANKAILKALKSQTSRQLTLC